MASDELLLDLEEEVQSTSSTDDAHTSGTTRRERLAARAGSVFSPRVFVLAVIALVAGLFLGNFIPLGPVGPLLGVFVAAFVLGTVLSEARYAETTVAGAGLVGLGALLENLTLAFLAGLVPGLGLAVVGAVLGGVIALVGHYFGRDLRAGVTSPLDG